MTVCPLESLEAPTTRAIVVPRIEACVSQLGGWYSESSIEETRATNFFQDHGRCYPLTQVCIVDADHNCFLDFRVLQDLALDVKG
jgi:hypothetical protein